MALTARPQLLVFDFDGVVVDSELLSNRLLAESVSMLGRPTTTDDSIRLFMGRHWEDNKRAIAAWTGAPLPDHFEAEHRARSRDPMRQDVQAVAGLVAFLEAHPTYARCVASSSSHDWLNHCTDKLGLRPHFARYLYSATEVANGKPAPDIFLHAADCMGAPPDSCVVLEDSAAGVTGARAAGMTVVGFLGGSHVRDGHGEALLAAGAHLLARDYADVARLLAPFR